MNDRISTGAVLVTGASGFIGGHLCEILHAQGYRVRAAYRRPEPPAFLSALGLPPQDLIRGDLADREVARSATAGATCVVHAAAMVADQGSPELIRRANVDLTKNLVAVAACEGVERFIYLSSIVVQGFGPHVDSTEEGPYYPLRFPYQTSKKCAEAHVLAQNRPGFRTNVIRPGDVCGPRDTTTFYRIFHYLERRLLGYVDKGRHLVAITSVRNLVEAIIRLVESEGIAGEVFTITDPVKVTWREVQEHICSLLGVRAGILNGPAWLMSAVANAGQFIYRLLGVRKELPITPYRVQRVANDSHFRPEKARRLLGYEGTVSWQEEMTRTVAAYREQKHQLELGARRVS